MLTARAVATMLGLSQRAVYDLHATPMLAEAVGMIGKRRS